MVLRAGESYVTDNGKTTVIQGAVTQEQKRWWEENHDKPLYKRSYRPSTPAEKLYLALCKNGSMRLQEALGSCGLDDAQKDEAQRALKILDERGNPRVNANSIVTKVTRPSFVGADLQGYDLEEADLRGADLWGANLQGADLRYADLRLAKLQGADLLRAKLQGADLLRADLWKANLRGAEMWGANLQRAQLRGADLWNADLGGANLRGANLREADLQEADLWKADLRGADISGANFDSAKNLKSASSLKLAFYHQNNPPKNLEDALNGVDAKQRPMALTSQEYENVCRLIADKKLMPLLRDSGGHLRKELDRLRDVCDTRIDSQQQVDTAVNAAKAKFGCSQSFPTPVVIMFSQGFNPPTRAAWYGNGTGGKVLQVISNGLESLNHLVGRGSR